jgi:hypothetical protein
VEREENVYVDPLVCMEEEVVVVVVAMAPRTKSLAPLVLARPLGQVGREIDCLLSTSHLSSMMMMSLGPVLSPSVYDAWRPFDETTRLRFFYLLFFVLNSLSCHFTYALIFFCLTSSYVSFYDPNLQKKNTL